MCHAFSKLCVCIFFSVERADESCHINPLIGEFINKAKVHVFKKS